MAAAAAKKNGTCQPEKGAPNQSGSTELSSNKKNLSNQCIVSTRGALCLSPHSTCNILNLHLSFCKRKCISLSNPIGHFTDKGYDPKASAIGGFDHRIGLEVRTQQQHEN